MKRIEFENEQIQTIYETLEKVDGENTVSVEYNRSSRLQSTND